MLLSDYIKTKEWRKKILETFIKKWKKCMKCWSEKLLQVHHSTYERLWNENIETDLFPLCIRCHNYFHKHYVWHTIQNTLEFLSIKELPKYKDNTKVKTNLQPIKKTKKVKYKKTKFKKRKFKKTKQKIKK